MASYDRRDYNYFLNSIIGPNLRIYSFQMGFFIKNTNGVSLSIICNLNKCLGGLK